MKKANNDAEDCMTYAIRGFNCEALRRAWMWGEVAMESQIKWLLNRDKKCVTLMVTFKRFSKTEIIGKVIVKCHKEDDFDEKIGVALSIERYRSKNKDVKQKYKYMRNVFTTNGELDYAKYAEWVIMDYVGYSQKKVEEIIVKNIKRI